jgi:hypothetical protein
MIAQWESIIQLKLNKMERREEKDLEHLWSMFCGKENSQEEHYFVDEDNLKMYMKLTDIYTDELIKWEEITNPETIIWVYGIFYNNN